MVRISLPAVLLSLCLASASAQQFQPKSIQFAGDSEYSDQELMAATGLHPGQTLTSAEMNQLCQKLMDSGLFDGVTYKFDGQNLAMQLTAAAHVYPVRLENLPLSNGPELTAFLHQHLPLYHGKVPSDGGFLDLVRSTLADKLKNDGIQAVLTAIPYNDPDEHKVTAISFSMLSPPVVIGDIQPDSSTPVEPKVCEVLAKMSGTPYDAEGSPRSIEQYTANVYRDQGYLEAEAHVAQQGAPTVTADSVRMPFRLIIKPGVLYHVAAIRLDPGVLVSQADFDQQSQLHAGDPADHTRIAENWEFLARQYHNRGYMRARILPTPVLERAHASVTYTVAVDPGPVYSMGKLSVEGASDELRDAFVGAFPLHPGMTFNAGTIQSLAIQGANPKLERALRGVKPKYTLRLNDDSQTVDVLVRFPPSPR